MSRFGLQDSTGLCTLRPGVKVKVTHPLASWVGRSGLVTRISGKRVYISIDDTNITCSVNHRSVEVLP